MKKVLIINFTRLGDILMSEPLVRGLNNQGFNVDYLVGKGFENILNHMPGIKKIYTYDIKLFLGIIATDKINILQIFDFAKKSISFLKDKKYQKVINLSHSDETKVLTSLVPAEEYIGITMDKYGNRIVEHPWENYFYASNLIRKFNYIHLTDIYMKLGNCHYQAKKIQFLLDREDKNLNKIASQNSFFCVQLGASTPEKRYDLLSFAKAINIIYNKSGLKPVFIGVKSEQKLFYSIQKYLECDYNELYGQTTINQLANLLKDAQYLITNDTGTMHIAASIGTKIICLALGSVSPFETAPYIEKAIIIEPMRESIPRSISKDEIDNNYLKYLTPNVLAEIVLNLDNIRSKESSFSFDKYQNLNIYITYFNNHFLRLKSLSKVELSIEEFISSCYFQVFVSTLPQKNYDISEVISRKFKISALVNELASCYTNISATFMEDLKKMKNILDNLLNLVHVGKSIVEDIGDKYLTNQYVKLNDLIFLLSENEKEITNLGLENESLRPLTYMFHFDTENMNSDKTDVLIEFTKVKYKLLSLRIFLLEKMLNIDIVSLFSI